MARHFVTGSTQYLTRTGAARSTRPLSMAVWAKPTTIVANSCLWAVLNSDGITGGWYLRVGGGGQARLMDYDNPTVVDALSTATFTAGAWAHVAGTTDAAANIVYLNGVGSSPLTPTARSTVASPRTDVGALFATPSMGFFWDGDLAEIGVWNVVLTPTEVAQLAAGKSPALVQPGALVAYYKLLGTSSPEPDEKGGTALTVTGATFATHPTIDYGTAPGLGRMFQVF
jgi:hypothetical protein